MSDRINIHDEVFAICDKLGLKAEEVRRLDFYPREITAEVFLLDESGSKYIREDGAVATDTLSFQVET